MTEYQIVKGDATSPIENKTLCFIPHIVNDIGVWGAGFVLAVSKKWKKAEEKYKQWASDGYYSHRTKTISFALGEVQPVIVEPKIVVINMVGQHGVGRGQRSPIRYGALTECMKKTLMLGQKYGAEIHCPKFGAGLAGGLWEAIEALIYEIWVDHGLPVTVYDYP